MTVNTSRKHVLRKLVEKRRSENTKMKATVAYLEIHQRHKEDGLSPKSALNMKPSCYNTRKKKKEQKQNSSTLKG
jgi:hypothetical protein